MKIAYVSCVYPPDKSGMSRAAEQFALVTAELGHRVTVFIPPQKEVAIQGNISQVKVIQLKSMVVYGHGAFILSLWPYLNKYDLVWLHYPFFGGAEVVWLKEMFSRVRFRLFLHYHMDVVGLPPVAQILSWPGRLVLSGLIKRAEAVSVASFDYAAHSAIKKLYCQYRDKFKEMPFGVDINRFRPNFKRPLKKEKTILFVGGLDRAHYFKGVDVLLRAVSQLKAHFWHLNIVGDGDLREKYEQEAKKLGIGEKVSFLGRLPDNRLVQIYQEADAFVLPSVKRNEAFGIVLLEAMASGLPVVASNLPGVRKVFSSGQEGFLSEPGNVIDLADKIDLILSNPDKQKAMSQAARRLVEEKYSLEKLRERIKEILR